MKHNFSNLTIEVTRRCNLECFHCLRGDAQDLDMDLDTIKNIFKHVDNISSLTISGGEPSLVPEIISQIIDIATKNKISIGMFYIATNAIEVSNKFMEALLKLYLYCDESMDYRPEDYGSWLDISNDTHHGELNTHNVQKLLAFRFASKKFKEDGHDYNRGRDLLFEGRSKDYFFTENEIKIYEVTMNDDQIDTIYLNAKGDLLPECDLSYDHQDEEDLIIGNVNNPKFNLKRGINKFNYKLKRNAQVLTTS